MSVILILVLASLSLAGLFLAAFVWAVRSGQFDDTQTPSLRVLTEDGPSSLPLAGKPGPETITKHEHRNI